MSDRDLTDIYIWSGGVGLLDKQSFFNFLKNKSINLNDFFTRLDRQRFQSMEYAILHNDASRINFGGLFIWADQKEGHQYWRNIQEEWEAYLGIANTLMTGNMPVTNDDTYAGHKILEHLKSTVLRENYTFSEPPKEDRNLNLNTGSKTLEDFDEKEV